ncbi:MAG: beta-hydroxyacyl-ACP dehydratase [Phycisphaerae bacterium]|jgi:3-hydroxyacyl-[acyl-carrier-protein] dehydratase
MRWMWIDRIIELVPRQRLVAVKHVSLAEEHLHDHFPAMPAAGPATANAPALPIMPMSLIVEGMAQSAGILVGHAGAFTEKVILAKVSKAEMLADATPGCTLRYTATVQHMDAQGAATTGIVELIEPASTPTGFAAPRTVGQIDLMFSHIDNNMAGTAFPAHNFVFGEGFKTLLRSSGIAWNEKVKE